MPRSLDLNRLRQFEGQHGGVGNANAVEPVEPSQPAAPAPIPLPHASMGTSTSQGDITPVRWPSREPVRDGQVSIKAPLDVIERFRAMCRDDRRTYADMLGILMDRFEER